jgi:hypothetical protein
MAGVKAARVTAGFITHPRRAKDWVAAPKVITVRVKGTPGPVVYATAPVATTDEQKKALSDYDTASKSLAKCVPNDKKSEGALAVAYQRLVQLGLRPSLRSKYRA